MAALAASMTHVTEIFDFSIIPCKNRIFNMCKFVIRLCFKAKTISISHDISKPLKMADSVASFESDVDSDSSKQSSKAGSDIVTNPERTTLAEGSRKRGASADIPEGSSIRRARFPPLSRSPTPLDLSPKLEPTLFQRYTQRTPTPVNLSPKFEPTLLSGYTQIISPDRAQTVSPVSRSDSSLLKQFTKLSTNSGDANLEEVGGRFVNFEGSEN